IEGERFVLRDKAGKVRATLGVSDGIVALGLYDNQNGRVRASLQLMANGSPYLNLLDEKENPAVSINSNQGRPGVVLYDEKAPRVILEYSKDGSTLIFVDDKHKPRVELGAMADGPKVLLYDTETNVRLGAGVAVDGAGVITRVTRDGKVTVP